MFQCPWPVDSPDEGEQADERVHISPFCTPPCDGLMLWRTKCPVVSFLGLGFGIEGLGFGFRV